MWRNSAGQKMVDFWPPPFCRVTAGVSQGRSEACTDTLHVVYNQKMRIEVHATLGNLSCKKFICIANGTRVK